jgi:hypothetical protein
MPTETIERHDIYQTIDALSDAALEKLASYAAFLKHEEWIEEQEDAEDIACIRVRRGGPTLPISEVIAKYEAKYGPLN